jgi:putative addiction module component (TIGR02574 family)
MSAMLQQIERDALALPPEQRAQLVDKLWDSLADTTYPALSETWRAEIERRRQRLAQGQATTVGGEEVSRQAWEIAGPPES